MISRSLFCRWNDCGSVRSKVQGLSTPFPFSKKAAGSHWSCTTWKSGFGSFHQKSQEESLHESQADTRPLGPWVSCCDSEVREWRRGQSGKGEKAARTLKGSVKVKFVICTGFPLVEGVRALSLSHSRMVFQAFHMALPTFAFISTIRAMRSPIIHYRACLFSAWCSCHTGSRSRMVAEILKWIKVVIKKQLVTPQLSE